MPDLVEQMYCSQQIFIPPNLPSILKKYAKAAIRTQPGDLLIWSSAYFRALAAGIPPPTKERIEYPPVETPSGLSPGFLKVLINQIGKGEIVSKEVLEERWRGVCLNPLALQDLLAVGMFDEEVHWLEFLAICAGTLQPSLTKTMMQLCELLTDEPQGGSAAIPVSMFLNLYKYLAKLDCGPVNTLEEYEKTLKEDSEIKCAAENLEPQEEAVERAIPNIDWNTAIEDGPTAGVAEAKPDDAQEVEMEEPECPQEGGKLEVDADGDTGINDQQHETTEDTVEGTADGEETGEAKDLDKPKDEPAEVDAGDAGDIDSDVSNEGDSGVATADESQDVKGSETDVPIDGVEPPINDDESGTVKVEQDEEVKEEMDMKVASINEAVPGKRTDSEEGRDDTAHTGSEVTADVGGTSPSNDDAQSNEKENLTKSDLDPSTDAEDPAQRAPSPSQGNESTEEPLLTKEATDGDQIAETDDTTATVEDANDNDPPAADQQIADQLTKEAELTPMLNIGTVYIIDDDGTLSAAPSNSVKDDGDLQERDSDKTIETNPSDAGMMVWPDIKPEKEEIDEDPVMEKEVLSDEGLEVFTEVDIPLVQDEIKIFPEKTMEEVTDASGNEGNIFAPQIDSFADLVEAESAPIEEFNEEDKLVVEASSDAGDESSPQIPVEQDAAPTAEVATPGTPQQQEEVDDGSKITSDSKSKKEVVIELLVKKDSEMMLLPTPKTSDVMLYNDNECEKCTLKVSPTQLLSDRMSLVDVHVAVPVDETVVEVVERHRYPKWMNIPGIGPVVPDHIIEEAEKYFVQVAELQEGMVMPRNMKHFHCPPLEMSPDCVEENKL